MSWCVYVFSCCVERDLMQPSTCGGGARDGVSPARNGSGPVPCLELRPARSALAFSRSAHFSACLCAAIAVASAYNHRSYKRAELL